MENKTKKIRKIGDSAGVIIPNKDLYKAEIKVGDTVTIESKKDTIVIKKGE